MYCGDKTGHTVHAVGDYVVITFHSDSAVQKGGFLLLFTVVPTSKCKESTSSKYKFKIIMFYLHT